MALGLVAVCGDRGASMKFSLFHMMSISTFCSSHVSFERSNHTWTKFIQIPNAVYENGKNCRSYTSFSEATRLNSLCCCKLTRAEINGFGAGRCVEATEPPWNSFDSMWCPSPLSALHMFLLKDLIILEPNSSKFQTQCMKMERIVGLTQVFLKRRDWTASVAASWHGLR